MTLQETETKTSATGDCVSNRPWPEVLNRSAKLLTFHAAKEGGRSLGRLVFYAVLALVVVAMAGWLAQMLTGWFTGWFDFWPFAAPATDPEPARGWFSGTATAPGETGTDTGWFSGSGSVAEPATDNQKWYCKWNPVC